MSFKACGGSLVLLCSLLLAGSQALSEPAPAASGAWVDPPVRGATGPGDPAPIGDAKPGSPSQTGARSTEEKTEKPAVAKAAPASPPAAPARVATAPNVAPRIATRPAARGLAIRRYAVPIRRLAVPRAFGAHRVAEAPVIPHRVRTRERAVRERVAAAPVRVAPHRRYARAIDRAPPAYADGPYEDVEPPMYARRAGWGGLVSRADRIAEAQASGYRVMRLRTYAYPDGRQFQQLMPVGPDAFY